MLALLKNNFEIINDDHIVLCHESHHIVPFPEPLSIRFESTPLSCFNNSDLLSGHYFNEKRTAISRSVNHMVNDQRTYPIQHIFLLDDQPHHKVIQSVDGEVMNTLIRYIDAYSILKNQLFSILRCFEQLRKQDRFFYLSDHHHYLNDYKAQLIEHLNHHES